jgi:hypothetical protein
MKSIADELYETLLEKRGELEAREILKRFFKIETDNREVAEQIVGRVLSSDMRFRKTGSGTWAAVKVTTVEELLISETPFLLFQMETAEDSVREQASEVSSFFLLYKGGISSGELSFCNCMKGAGQYIFVPYDSKSLNSLKRAYRIVSPLPPELKTLSVRTLLSALFPGRTLRTWEDVIHEFAIITLTSSGPRAKVQNLKEVLEHALSAAQEQGITVTRDLLRLGIPARKEVDFSQYGFDRERLNGIPQCPGVYTFTDREGKVIYVGKTNNLRIRINSYFWNTGESPDKIEKLLKELYLIDTTELGSDLEALVEEQRLIERHEPKYNTRRSIPERTVSVSRRILIPRTLSKGMLKLYLIADGLPLLEHEYWCGGTDMKLRVLIGEMRASEGYVFDPLKSIAVSYMSRYEANLTIIDIDRYATVEDVERVLFLQCEEMRRGETEKSVFI